MNEGHKVELQIEALRIQTRQLRIHRKALNKISKVRKVELNDAFDAYAKRSCLELSKNIQKTFPREVRDIIYGYITGRELVKVSRSSKKTSKNSPRLSFFSTTLKKNTNTRDSERCDDHWWNEDFVGTDMIRELVEHFYRSCCFLFGEDFGIIPCLRVVDQWGMGVLPVSFISNVEVTVKCSDYGFGLGVHEDSWGNGINEWDFKQDAKLTSTALLVHLESLFGFRPGTAITIKTISLYVENPSPLRRQEQMCNEVLKFIFPVFQRLKDMNCRVRAILDGGTDWLFPAAPFVSQWNPTSHEAVTEAFWKVRVAQSQMI